ncbi:MAG: hypothetical protein H6742_20410 [Alphaproteobacteria bacterium]|nr:hypothetical protein [Alphaproteobacteria bacterium]
MQTRSAFVFALGNLVMGAAMALVAASPAAGPFIQAASLLHSSVDAAAADTDFARWVLGIAGGVWAGWGAAMVAQTRGLPAGRAHLIGLSVWCLLDSAASVANGAPLNVLVNLPWLVLGLWLLRTPAAASPATRAAA